MGNNIKVISDSTQNEIENRDSFVNKLLNTPIEKNEILQNLGLYVTRQNLSRMLFIHELYKKIINVHGVIIEFGVRWGQNLALFQNLRGIYEPYNYNRKIIGFDTFAGFPQVHSNDGNVVEDGDYSVTKDYDAYLDEVLQYHESESPIPHIKKYEIIKGDATKTLENYLKENPQTIIALAYFDFDLYIPTKKCLELIADFLTKGSVIGFDELNCKEFPGETIALKEVLGLKKFALQRSPLNPLISYFVVE